MDEPVDKPMDPAYVPLWRALAVFRLAALGYSVALVVHNFPTYQHPTWGWPVLAVMAAWTAWTTYAYSRRPATWPLLIADLAVAAVCLLATRPVVEWSGIGSGKPTLPMVWIAGPVLAWAISGGRRRGVVAALLLGACDVFVRGRLGQSTLTGTVLMLLAGLAVGHVARLAVVAQERMRQAAELTAASRERERIARGIHDSVLQVLALVQRRGLELGGEAAELGRLAGEQETALRSLVLSDLREPDGRLDLREVLGRFASGTVTLAAPATPVPLPATTATEIGAAVGGALANVHRHVGPDAPAWVLVEDDGDEVTVTVRDDGPGIAPGRLAEAEADGRLGVAQSIRGRMAALGGTAEISSTPEQGTEVELRVYRDGRDRAGDPGDGGR